MPADKSPLTIVPEIKSRGTTQPQIFILLKKKEETLEGQKKESQNRSKARPLHSISITISNSWFSAIVSCATSNTSFMYVNAR